MSQQLFSKLAQISSQLPALIKRLPGIAKVEGLAFISNNFKAQGFESKPGAVQKWRDKKKGSKPTLIGEKRGGALRRSWKGDEGANRVEFSSSLPYAAVHNEGLKSGRPPGFTMPERAMIGKSEALNQRIVTKFDKLLKQLLK